MIQKEMKKKYLDQDLELRHKTINDLRLKEENY